MSAAAVWDEIADPISEQLRNDLIELVRETDAAADRSQQIDLGPSQIGNPCSLCLAEQILGVHQPPPFDDPWTRIIGTAIHNWLEEAAAKANVRNNDARWIPECRVHPDPRLLPSGGRCDLYDSTTATVIDHKTVGATQLKKYKLNGPGATYRRQAHLYGLGYFNAGHEVHNVALAFWPRGARATDLYVWTEPFDVAIAEEALERYDQLRQLCQVAGTALLANLTSDSDCFVCSRLGRV